MPKGIKHRLTKLEGKQGPANIIQVIDSFGEGDPVINLVCHSQVGQIHRRAGQAQEDFIRRAECGGGDD